MADPADGGDAWVRDPSRSPREPVSASGEGSAFSFGDRRGEESIPELLRNLVEQGSHLAEQQTKLVQAEVRSAVGDLTTAVGAMAGAGVVAIAGLGVLLMGLSFLIARAMPLWAATVLVAAATMLVAYAMFTAGRKKIEHSSLHMDRSRHAMERAPNAITGNMKEGNNRGR